MFLLPLLLGCSHTYTPEQRAKITALQNEFVAVCERSNEYTDALDMSCEVSSHGEYLSADDAAWMAECERNREKRIAGDDAPSRSLDVIVADRDAAGLGWPNASWICISRDHAPFGSKFEAGPQIDNGHWY